MLATSKLSYRQIVPQTAYMELAATLVLCARAGHPFSDRQLASIAEWVANHNPSFSRAKWLECINQAISQAIERKGNEVTK